MQPPRQEFWLKAGREEYGWDPAKTLPIYRVALGELIDATQRETFPPPKGSHVPDFWNKSGSIGFMDLTVKDELVPKDDATPYKDQEYLNADCENVRALVISKIGIETGYQRRGYARLLKQRAEEIATEWGLEVIVSEQIDNPIMREFNIRLGYTLFDRVKAVKRIKKSQVK